MEKYKFNWIRVLIIWTMPVLVFSGCMFLLFKQPIPGNALSFERFVMLLFFFTILLVAPGILFFNHLKKARFMELYVGMGQMDVLDQDELFSIQFSEIKRITEYSTARSPWAGIKKWVIETQNRRLIISSLTISPFSFNRYFDGRINYCLSIFPLL